MTISNFSASIGISQPLIDGNYEAVLLQGHDKKMQEATNDNVFCDMEGKVQQNFQRETMYRTSA
jgi:hypothetical protein